MIVAELKHNYFENINERTHKRINEFITDATAQVLRDAVTLCPVDTGNLEHSIHMTVDDLSGSVGTPVYYAPYVEFGTYKMGAKPFLYPALKMNQSTIHRTLGEIIDGKL